MGNSKGVSVKKNYLYSLSYQILLILVPLVTTPYISRVLGADGVGKYSYTTAIVTYFGFIGILGLNTYGQLEIAKAKEDVEKRSVLFYEITATRLVTNFASLCVYMILIACSSKYRNLYIVQSIVIFANALDLTWFFQGIEEFKKIAIRNIIIKVTSVALIFSLVKEFNDLYIYILICNGATLLGNICLMPMIKKYIIKPKKEVKIDLRKHVKGATVFFVPSIATVIMTSLDKTMIEWITQSETENGYYAQAYKIESLCFTVFSSLNLVMRSRMAFLFHAGKKEEIGVALKKSLEFVLLIVFPMSFGMMGISSKFVPWFFGLEYVKVTALMRIFSFWLIFKAISNCLLEQYIMASGKQKLFNIIIWIGASGNTVLNLFLIYFYQSTGAAIASVVAEIIIFVFALWYSRGQVHIKPFIWSSVKYLFASIVMGYIINEVAKQWQNNILTTVAQCSMGVIIYFLILFLVRDDYICGISNRILQKAKRG